jgi:hypothetical protein
MALSCLRVLSFVWKRESVVVVAQQMNKIQMVSLSNLTLVHQSVTSLAMMKDNSFLPSFQFSEICDKDWS